MTWRVLSEHVVGRGIVGFQLAGRLEWSKVKPHHRWQPRNQAAVRHLHRHSAAQSWRAGTQAAIQYYFLTLVPLRQHGVPAAVGKEVAGATRESRCAAACASVGTLALCRFCAVRWCLGVTIVLASVVEWATLWPL